MAITDAATMSSGSGDDGRVDDGHEHDLVMPGFRFHPTEEELVEFYLRRKVEGKRFNVELITFLDLYRYDPWELPALAAIGEKEWFFYVPRDRKYRNGDRPNRVTTSGYWKATGADRMIRGENLRSIGLKKTLVFYSGKAPKGIRTSWIMNEYRLPQSETDKYQKAEISLCRVYKRPGVDDHYQLPNTLSSSRPSSSKTSQLNAKDVTAAHQPTSTFKTLRGEPSTRSPTKIESMHQLGEGITNKQYVIDPLIPSIEEDRTTLHGHSKNPGGLASLLASTPTSFMDATTIEEINRLVGYNNQSYINQPNQALLPLPSQQQLLPLNMMPISDKLWEWNQLLPEAARDYTSFK